MSATRSAPLRAMLAHAAASGWLRPLFGAVGLAVALVSALGPLRGSHGSAGEAIAVVDGRAIPRATYQRAIAALEADKRNPVTPADRRMALSRLIDEDLLVKRAIDLGLADAEPSVRKALVDAMLQLASQPELRDEPSEAELRQFYDGRPTMFAGEPLLSVSVAVDDTVDRAGMARLAGLLRAGAAFDAAVSETGLGRAPQPPPLTPARKLGDYVGPTVAAAARQLAAGEVMGPMQIGGRSMMIYVRDRKEGQRPAFESVREQTLEAWRRTASDRALEAYLAGLRNRAAISYAADAPK